MRSLEIRTNRIFNNLIEQNQKLAADFVLKRSKIVCSAQSPTPSIKSPQSSTQNPASSVQSLASRVQCPGFRVQRPESSVQRPASRVHMSRVQRPESSVHSPVSIVQRPESRVQNPTPNSCVQSPEIPVYPVWPSTAGNSFDCNLT